jgi:hypothetical protein
MNIIGENTISVKFLSNTKMTIVSGSLSAFDWDDITLPALRKVFNAPTTQVNTEGSNFIE